MKQMKEMYTYSAMKYEYKTPAISANDLETPFFYDVFEL